MKMPILRHAVTTPDNHELLPAGVPLSREVLSDLIARRDPAGDVRIPVLKYGSILGDLRSFLQISPYNVVFADPQEQETVFSALSDVTLAQSALASLDYFKVHDAYTYRHTLNVLALSVLLARLLDQHDHDQDPGGESVAAPVHDIGKICVPLPVLRKTTPLTQAERAMVEHHTVAGYVLLACYQRDLDGVLAKIAVQHHERRDGTGYPLGLPLEDRLVEIIAVADTYDSLISARPYRRIPFDNRTALEEITGMAARGKFRWDVVRALIGCNRRPRVRHEDLAVSAEQRGTPPKESCYGVTI